MKKNLMIVAGVVFVATVAFVGISTQESQPELKAFKYADARLSALELQQGIEAKINFLLDEVKEKNIQPTTKGLTQLIRSIEIVRAYGKDISKEEKEKLHQVVYQLKSSGFVDNALLKKLDEMANSSVEDVV